MAAFSVHLLTASGAAVALLALVATIAGEFTVMFALLGIALLIDGVDGALARRVQVADMLPRWSGDQLDLIVDFLNYVFVPALALASGAILPQALALPAALVIVVTSAFYFADTRMKTDDGYFRGFPALWNLVAFYLFLLHPDPLIALLVVAFFVVMTFMPVVFVHPLRARRWAAINIAVLLAWVVLGLVALAYHLSPPPIIVLALVALGVYFLLAGLTRPVRRGS